MAITHNITLGVASGGNVLSRSFTSSGGQEIDISEAVPDASTNLEIAFAAVRNKLKSFYMVADQALTVETNDGATPGDTFSLEADKPVYWNEGSPVAISSFFSADITALFATNASGEDATLIIKALIDPT